MILSMLFLILVMMVLPAAAFAGGVEREGGNDYMQEGAYFSTIASGHLEAIKKAPGVISVITADEMAKMGATHLDEVLETIPGLHVVRSDLNRLEPVYSIRGIQSGFSPQVLILFNGVELKNPFNGGLPAAFRMPLNGIERIEVIKGASSALYGANAYSGVINIVPKRARDNSEVIAQARFGSFDSSDLTVQHRQQNDSGAGIFLSLERQSSRGDRQRIVTQDLQALIDPVLGTDASLAPGPLNTEYAVTNLLLNVDSDHWSWSNWLWHQDDAGTGQGVARALDNEGDVNSRSLMSHLQYRRIVDHEFSIESNFSYHYLNAESRFKLFPDNSLVPVDSNGNPVSGMGTPVLFTDGVIGEPDYASHKAYADFSYQYMGMVDQIWRFQWGAQYTMLKTSERKNYGPGVIDGTVSPIDGALTDVSDLPYVYLSDQERHSLFFAVQDQWHFQPDWTLTLGGRWDQYSDFGGIFNPRLGLVWEPHIDFTGKLLYGEAFRAPSFSELYLKNNPSGLGSASLKPEQIKTYELVADYLIAPSVRLISSVYYYEAEDLIENKLVGNVFQFQNTMQQEGYGFELETHWTVNRQLKLKGQYSYQHSENRETGATVAGVPNHTGYLAVDYTLPDGWTLQLNNHWIGSRAREQSDSREKLSGYSWGTLKVSKAFKPQGLTAAVIVKNLWDADARSPASSIVPGDYPLERRSVWGELTYRF